MDVIEVRKKLTEYTKILANLPKQDFYRQALADYRQIDKKWFDSLQCFYINNTGEILNAIGDDFFLEDLGFYPKMRTFAQRFMFPCYTIDGLVAGFICYDNLSTYKYIPSNTLGFSKSSIPFGLNTYNRILQNDYCIVVEGVMDYVRVMSLGYPVLPFQGTVVPKSVRSLIRRLKGVILISDNDTTGKNALYYWKDVNKITTSIRIEGVKDIDEALINDVNIKSFDKIVKTILNNWSQGDTNSQKLICV